jgi:hypothetical protein
MVTPAVRCPSCGWDGTTAGKHDEWFRHLEDVTLRRRVEGLNREGILEISAEEQVEADESHKGARLSCGNCLAEFPVPVDLRISFIDPY